MMSNLIVKIPDFGFTTSFSNVRKCSSIDDMKNLVAELLHADSKLINFSNEKDIKLDSNNIELELTTIKEYNKDINLHVPKGKKIEITNCNSMKFDDIFDFLQKKRNDFFTPSCPKDKFLIKKSHEEFKSKYDSNYYPFLFCKKGERFELGYSGKLVYIEFDQKKFYFADQEIVKNAKKYIFDILQKEVLIQSIDILGKDPKEVLKDDYPLKIQEDHIKTAGGCNCTLKIECSFDLKSKTNENASNKKSFDYFAKVSEAQDLLVIFYSDYKDDLKQSNIIIFDQQGQKVTDNTKLLKDIQTKDHVIYFDIEGIQSIPDSPGKEQPQKSEEKPEKFKKKRNLRRFRPQIKSILSVNNIPPIVIQNQSKVQINFNFENNEFDPFSMDVNLNDKMKDLSKIIAEKYDIKDKVHFQYTSGEQNIEFGQERTVYEVKDDIKQADKNGDSNIHLSIVIKKTKSKKDKKKKSSSGKSKETEILFEYDYDEKKIKLPNDSSLKENESVIKKAFEIDEENNIEFKLVDENDDDKELSDEEKIENLKNKKIKVVKKLEVIDVPTADDDSEGEDKKKYMFQTNRSDSIFQIKLKAGSTVKTLKSSIASMYSVDNLANIKIIFCGKDLLEDIVLDDLNIGDTILYVYVRSTDDILLMTSKALRINQVELMLESDNDIIEEEEEAEG